MVMKLLNRLVDNLILYIAVGATILSVGNCLINNPYESSVKTEVREGLEYNRGIEKNVEYNKGIEKSVQSEIIL